MSNSVLKTEIEELIEHYRFLAKVFNNYPENKMEQAKYYAYTVVANQLEDVLYGNGY